MLKEEANSALRNWKIRHFGDLQVIAHELQLEGFQDPAVSIKKKKEKAV